MQIQKSKKPIIGQVPENWEVIKIKEISKVRRGASPRPIEGYPRYFGNGRGWIRMKLMLLKQTNIWKRLKTIFLN